jgi:hypothetical protein
MDDTTDTASGLDSIDAVLKHYVDNVIADSGATEQPLPGLDAQQVISHQLGVNTGSHPLDSGGAYGRHWEQNQESPPAQEPEWDVRSGYVIHNVYHWMLQSFSRDDVTDAMEASLYAYGHEGAGEGQSWLYTMQDWSDRFVEGTLSYKDQAQSGLPDEVLEIVYGLGDRSLGPVTTANTYNGGEWHTLSQCLQMALIGGPYPDYALVQVHGGADIRGGYTAPRVYSVEGSCIPMELSYNAESCDWWEAESVVYDDERLVYQPTLDAEALYEEAESFMASSYTQGEAIRYARDAVDEAEEATYIDGGVFLLMDDGPHHVTFC